MSLVIIRNRDRQTAIQLVRVFARCETTRMNLMIGPTQYRCEVKTSQALLFSSQTLSGDPMMSVPRFCIKCNHRRADCTVTGDIPKCDNYQGVHAASCKGCKLYKEETSLQPTPHTEKPSSNLFRGPPNDH